MSSISVFPVYMRSQGRCDILVEGSPDDVGPHMIDDGRDALHVVVLIQQAHDEQDHLVKDDVTVLLERLCERLVKSAPLL